MRAFLWTLENARAGGGRRKREERGKKKEKKEGTERGSESISADDTADRPPPIT